MAEAGISTPPSARLEGIDLARAIAIFGMTVVNFGIYISAAESDPAWLREFIGLFSGRAAATFVFVAGVGVSLLTMRWRRERTVEERRKARFSLLKRAAFLFIVGVSFRARWSYDILHFYGVYLAFAALVFTLNARWLVALAAATALGFVALYFVLPPALDLNYWASPRFDTVPNAIQDLFFTGHHPVTPWFAFFLCGMAVGRIDLSNAANQWRLMLGGAALVAVAALTNYAMIGLGFVKAIPAEDAGFALDYVADIFGTSAYPPAPLYILFGLGVGMAVLGLSLKLTASAARRRFLQPVIHAGQMALTLYLAHVFVGVTAIQWFLPESWESKWTLLACVVAFFVLAVIFATLWRRRFARGPVEWAMRRLVT